MASFIIPIVLSGEVADFAADDVVATVVLTYDNYKSESISCYNRRPMLWGVLSL